MIKFQTGLTLIELMISLVLGLLIVAAGLAIYLSGQRSITLQNGMSELQQNSIFGLSVLTFDLRQINLNTVSGQQINNKTVGSGIIFGSKNLPRTLTNVNEKYFTQQESDEAGTEQKSDQLFIQYVPQYNVADATLKKNQSGMEYQSIVTQTKMFNCEGTGINFEAKSSSKDISPEAAKPVIVQRYFVAEVKQDNKSYIPKRYALYCDAGYYNPTDSAITGLGTYPQQIIQNVDAFKIRLLVKDQAGRLQYTTINHYNNGLMAEQVVDPQKYYQVISVEIGVLAHSNHPVGPNINKDKMYSLFADPKSSGATQQYGELTLKPEQNSKSQFLRQGFSQVVALRNTLGAS